MTHQEYLDELAERALAKNQTSSASWRGKVALGEADARPGRYYVTARDAGRNAFLLGPFVQTTWGKEAHARALGQVARVKRLACETFARADFAAYGTAWMPLYGDAPVGKLNGAIGGTR